jgi:hypothetical protein
LRVKIKPATFFVGSLLYNDGMANKTRLQKFMQPLREQAPALAQEYQ